MGPVAAFADRFFGSLSVSYLRVDTAPSAKTILRAFNLRVRAIL